MTITFNLTDGGSKTLTISPSGFDGYCQSYDPVVPDAGVEYVWDTIEITLTGGSAAVFASKTLIETLFDYAREAQLSPLNNRIFFKVNNVDGNNWRSEVYDGKILGTPEWIKGELALGQRTVTLMIKRAPWFELNAALYAEITNSSGTNSDATGLVVYNHNDGGHDNFVSVGTITGDLPAPAILSARKTGARPNVEVFAGMATYAKLADLVLEYEGEAATAGTGVTLAAAADAASSGGNYGHCTWTGTSEMMLGYWDIATGAASAFAGRIFRPLIRLKAAIGGTDKFWASLQVSYDGAGPIEKLWQSEEILLNNANLFHVLQPAQLPPWPVPIFTTHPFTLSLQVRCESAGAHAIDLDVMELLPCDSFLRLIPVITTFPDMLLNYDCQTRLLLNNAKYMTTHVAEGPGLWLTPGQSHRMVLAMKEGAGWDIALNPNVFLQYRPRVRTI